MTTSTSTSNLKPLLLHAHTTGPNPIKIAIALEYLSLPYTVKHWDFSTTSTGVKGPEFLAINPNGRVPALHDPNTDVTSWESGAVLAYLLRTYDSDNKILGPVDASPQGLVDFDKWVYFLVSTLGPMTGQVNWFRHYHGKENNDALERYVKQTERCYGVLEEQLGRSGGETVLGGGRVSAVDLHFEPWLRQHAFAGVGLETFPKVEGWLKGMEGRKEVKEAYRRIKEGTE